MVSQVPAPGLQACMALLYGSTGVQMGRDLEYHGIASGELAHGIEIQKYEEM